MDLGQIQKEIAKFVYELSNEDRRVRVGLKNKSEVAKIYKKYSHLFTKKVLKDIAAVKTGNADEEEIKQRCYFFIASCFIEQSLASAQDKISTYYSNATVNFKGQKVAFYNLNPLISKEKDFDTRDHLDLLSIKVTKKATPKELALLKAEISGYKTIGFKGYLDFAKKSKNVDYFEFEKVVKKIAAQTESVWWKNIESTSLLSLGKKFKKGTFGSSHLLYLRSIALYDLYYPKDKIVSTYKQFAKDLGMADLLKGIIIDDADRPKKNPRAVCYWADPPKEVHLVIKPIGGEQDYEAMFHEGGHALHAACEHVSDPYAFRDMSRSHALTEAYAFVLEDLVFEPDWLAKYLKLDKKIGENILRDATFVNLMLLRRYLGKYRYEYEVFSENKLASAASIYSKRLSETTGFVYQKEKYLVDMDGHFYSADYLRAWIGAAQIKDYLLKKYGRKWFENPKAGRFLRELWQSGVKYDLEEIVQKLGYKKWDISYLIKGYGVLAGNSK